MKIFKKKLCSNQTKNKNIGIHACGTNGNLEAGQYGYASDTSSGTYFENIIVIQYDPQVQEVWDQARKLRCTWHDQYEKSVTFRPFPVDMLDIVRADFAGDNVGCWMQIQVLKIILIRIIVPFFLSFCRLTNICFCFLFCTGGQRPMGQWSFWFGKNRANNDNGFGDQRWRQ